MNFYRLHIATENKAIYDSVSKILNVLPSSMDEESFGIWVYGIEDKDEDSCLDFINIFMDILEPNLMRLESIGIERSDISIWRIYEYDQQCGMEISPADMSRLGNNGITLCIDCFQK